jgi:hypothetical protein
MQLNFGKEGKIMMITAGEWSTNCTEAVKGNIQFLFYSFLGGAGENDVNLSQNSSDVWKVINTGHN